MNKERTTKSLHHKEKFQNRKISTNLTYVSDNIVTKNRKLFYQGLLLCEFIMNVHESCIILKINLYQTSTFLSLRQFVPSSVLNVQANIFNFRHLAFHALHCIYCNLPVSFL